MGPNVFSEGIGGLRMVLIGFATGLLLNYHRI
ncbi:hypothetical protein DVH24_003661 [Malus domestica]|uniref:Uncharacterized protein n=1 Tax=Malus domestica TaxID=3750 RepID=A0A498IPK9_MALDO|nr:hypothetical protein DVH24_003661 [Malus domestica]